MNEKILKQIRDIREEKGISLKGLSERTKISYNYLLSLENGKNNNPTLNVLTRIAKVLEVEIGFFYLN